MKRVRVMTSLRPEHGGRLAPRIGSRSDPLRADVEGQRGPKPDLRVHGKEIPAVVGTSSVATCCVSTKVERSEPNR